MALFGDSAPMVPASVVEQFLAAMEAERTRSHEVVKEALALKRHDLQMPPAGWTPGADPMELLGPKTQLAIEEFAAGDPQARRYLIGRATILAAAHKAQGHEPDEADADVAETIQAGET